MVALRLKYLLKVLHTTLSIKAESRNRYRHSLNSPIKQEVVFACALAVASAGYLSPLGYGAHHVYGGHQVYGVHHVEHQHLPVIGADGVPVDTAAVQQAKVEHSVHKAHVEARNGDLYHGVVAHGVVAHGAVVAAPVVSTYATHYTPSVYTGPQHVPVIGATGVPVETPEVQHAKAAHLVHKAEVQARNGASVHAVVAPVVAHSVVSHHVPVVAHGLPVETPEVQHAKIAHFAAHAEANARNAVVAHSVVSHEVPVIANGVPVDTVEVQHAKAAHFAAKAEAHARNGDYVHGVVGYTGVVAPVAHHVPAIVNGVPVDTVEVQHAKAAHYAAKAQALNGHYSHGIVGYTGVVAPVAHHVPVVSTYAHHYAPSVYTGPQHVPVIDASGVPVETPEVQHAKAVHLAAHVKTASKW
ncbi:PREDICTED: uncharacterized protein LOC108562732 [Nicrophorus vespilloides]|uniref:Uncharacterized protein LOC108562732 n=1 Tax=Nicrophorus vespilloides TaxID=110193 RepID=A0ABM1MPY7_NICVS|nr:PREDICTED: uncharacterized protein LOC108562732 [Nicrophorus vespilloides]